MKKYILYKFFAEWCGPCRTLSEVFYENKDDFNAKYGDILSLKEIDVDEDDALCIRYKIKSIPALVLVNNENALNSNGEVMRHIGSLSYIDLCNKLDDIIKRD